MRTACPAFAIYLAAFVAGCHPEMRPVAVTTSPEPRAVTVTGDADVKVEPDLVEVTVGVESIDTTVAAVKAKNETAVAQMLAAVTKAGVAGKDAQTEYVYLEPQYRNWEKRELIGYIARRTVRLTLRDVHKFEPVLSAVLESGGNVVMGVQFRTSELRKYRDQARALAIQAAREKADALAKELGQELDRPHRITEQQSSWSSLFGWWGGYGGGGQAQNVVQNASRGGSEVEGHDGARANLRERTGGGELRAEVGGVAQDAKQGAGCDLSCSRNASLGTPFCGSCCASSAPCGIFRYHRVERPGDVPPADPLAIDVAVLDLNHGWPNLGHDLLVHAVLDSGCELLERLTGTGLHLRAISYEVRRSGTVPAFTDRRFPVYLGTGGPGHFDPRRNDGHSPGSQGLVESSSWESPLFRLFDAILADPEAALFGVCHCFGLLCRWSGAAEPRLRAPDQSKTSGLVENWLTAEASEHPWFGRWCEMLPDRRRLRVADNRQFDLLPAPGGLPGFVLPIGYETRGIGGPAGEAVTMLELARDREGIMPRVFATNHHPEIVGKVRQVMIIDHKRARGEVTREWCDKRLALVDRTYPDADSERDLHLTSELTLLGPLRFQLWRQVRLRAESLGLAIDVHEAEALRALPGIGYTVHGPVPAPGGA